MRDRGANRNRGSFTILTKDSEVATCDPANVKPRKKTKRTEGQTGFASSFLYLLFFSSLPGLPNQILRNFRREKGLMVVHSHAHGQISPLVLKTRRVHWAFHPFTQGNITMPKLFFGLLSCAAATLVATQVNAQPPGGPGGPGGRPIPPVMAALDADNNGEISAKELENASKALATLDKNKDGKLTEDELRPEMGRGGFGGGFGGVGGGGRPNTEEIFSRMDTDKDGKLSKDEIPEQMKEFVGRADDDKDGTVTKEEMTKMFARFRGGPGGAWWTRWRWRWIWWRRFRPI